MKILKPEDNNYLLNCNEYELKIFKTLLDAEMISSFEQKLDDDARGKARSMILKIKSALEI